MRRKLFSLILTLIMVLSSCSFALADQWGDFIWSFENGVLSIDGEGEITQYGPWMKSLKKATTLELGAKVTACYKIFISHNAAPKLQKIIIHGRETNTGNSPDNLKEVVYTAKNPVIDGGLFRKCRLKSITIEDPDADYVFDGPFLLNKERSILYYYFEGNEKEVIIPESVKNIEEGAFSTSKIVNVVLPSNLEIIGSSSFNGCKNLKSIVIPASTKIIGGYAFGSSGLQEVSLQSVNVVFGLSAFSDCNNLKSFVFPEGFQNLSGEYNNDNMFARCKQLKTVFFPDSVQIIDFDVLALPTKTTILCREGSKAQQFAESYNYKYQIVTSIESILLSDTALSIQKGKQATLKYEVSPASADVSAVKWYSTDDKVATVNKGKVKGISAGECDIVCEVIAADGSSAKAVSHVSVLDPKAGNK